MNVVDSSAWLEYIAGGSNADFFATPIEDVKELLVPTITVFEVFKRLLIQRDRDAALRRVVHMYQGRTVSLDAELALTAALLSAEHRLPMADSVILATARAHDATLWTQDADFKDFDGVQYRKRKP